MFDFTYDGPRLRQEWHRRAEGDGKEVASKKIPHTIPFLMALDETFDVGVDMRTPVDDNDYRMPFRFTGKLAKLTFKLVPEQLSDEHRKAMHHQSERLGTRVAACAYRDPIASAHDNTMEGEGGSASALAAGQGY